MNGLRNEIPFKTLEVRLLVGLDQAFNLRTKPNDWSAEIIVISSQVPHLASVSRVEFCEVRGMKHRDSRLCQLVRTLWIGQDDQGIFAISFPYARPAPASVRPGSMSINVSFVGNLRTTWVKNDPNWEVLVESKLSEWATMFSSAN